MQKPTCAQVLFVVRKYADHAVAVSAWWQESLHGLIYPVAPWLLQRAQRSACMQCVGAARQKAYKARICSLHRRKCYISYEWNLIKAPPSSWHLNRGLWLWRGSRQLLIISAQQFWGKENICLCKGWRLKRILIERGKKSWKIYKTDDLKCDQKRFTVNEPSPFHKWLRQLAGLPPSVIWYGNLCNRIMGL